MDIIFINWDIEMVATEKKQKKINYPDKRKPKVSAADVKKFMFEQAAEAAKRNLGIGHFYDVYTPRLTEYDAEIGKIICDRLVLGEALAVICRHAPMPHVQTVHRWEESVPEFGALFSHARRKQASALVDESRAITDELDLRVAEGKLSDFNMIRAHTELVKLRAATRQWCASKLDPGKYGDKPAIEQQDSADDKFKHLNNDQRLERISEIINSASARKDK